MEITECKGYYMESGYGYGYDRRRPDLYSPDHESCTPTEISNHAVALAEFQRCLRDGCEFVCPVGSWGIGIYQYEVSDDQPHN